MLKIDNLSFAYSKKEPLVLNSLSLSLDDSSLGVILGPNGAGKSTLLKCIDGITKVNQGSLFLNDEDLLTMKRKAKAQKIAYVPQQVELAPVDVYQNVLLGRIPYSYFYSGSKDQEKALDAIKTLGLEELMGKMPNALSGGERQKVAIARALASEPTLLLLDEPTANLDLKNQEIVIESLLKLKEQEKLSILISMHDINLALRIGDSFHFFNEGKIAFTGKKEDITSSLISNIYGVKGTIKVVDGERIFIQGEKK